MGIERIYFVPHPPIIIEEIGREDCKKVEKTIKAYEHVAKDISEINPDTIIMVSPHGMSFENGISILKAQSLSGNLELFGAPEIKSKKDVNIELTNRIEHILERHDLSNIAVTDEIARSYRKSLKLDHGSIVPFYFIDRYSDLHYNVVYLTPGHDDIFDYYIIGKAIEEAIGEGHRCVMVCSGDLSHALMSSGPYDFHESGPKFDALVKEAIEKKEPSLLLNLASEFIENAAQCGLRSFLMGFGVLDGFSYTSNVLSYEGPFGVGYLTAVLTPVEASNSYIKKYEEERKLRYYDQISRESLYVSLARATIEHYIKTNRKISYEEFESWVLSRPRNKYTKEEIDLFVLELTGKRHGCFVSIHKNGFLRGCMGTIEAVNEDLFDEIIYNAITASNDDPRFDFISEIELPALEISVDVLMPVEAVKDLTHFDVKKYGMIVEKGRRRGLLLPNLDSVNTVQEQYRICLDKAGIYLDDGVKLYRFEVIRYR